MLCAWCGYDKESVGADEACADCRAKVDEWRREREALLARYRCRRDDPSVLPMTWDEALARVAAKVGHPIEVTQEGACESATWWYVPYTWIGCSGYFVDKADGLVTELGSCHPVDLDFWAHDRGFRYPCDVIIERVHDLAGTITFLQSVLAYPEANQRPRRGWSSAALTRTLSALPCRFRHQELWFQLPDFRERALPSLFEYRLERDSGPDPKPRAKRVLLTMEAFRAIAERPDDVELLQRAHDAGIVDVIATWEHYDHSCHDAIEIPRDERKKVTPEGRSLLKEARRVAKRREQVPCRIVGAVPPHIVVGATPGMDLEAFRAWLISSL
jgi:hypothetical protein